jgi:hypothetical protein
MSEPLRSGPAGSVLDVVNLEFAAASTAGNLAAVFVAFFDFAPPLATNKAFALAEIGGVATFVRDHDVDVGIAQHAQCRVDRDADRLVQAVAVTVDLAPAIATIAEG